MDAIGYTKETEGGAVAPPHITLHLTHTQVFLSLQRPSVAVVKKKRYKSTRCPIPYT